MQKRRYVFKLMWGIKAPRTYDCYGEIKLNDFITTLGDKYNQNDNIAMIIGLSYFLKDKNQVNTQHEQFPIIGVHVHTITESKQGLFDWGRINKKIKEVKKNIPPELIKEIQGFLHNDNEKYKAPALYYIFYTELFDEEN